MKKNTEAEARRHPRAPHNQPFQLRAGRPNSKRKAWYKIGSRNVKSAE